MFKNFTKLIITTNQGIIIICELREKRVGKPVKIKIIIIAR